MDNKMKHLMPTSLFDGICILLRKLLFKILAFGPMPRHVAFVPDGNRRYGHKHNLPEGGGHRAGLARLMSILRYSYEMGIPCVSVYGFSIDNFKRKPAEVHAIMRLVQGGVEAFIRNADVFNELGIRIKFLGNLDLFDESVRETMKRAMEVTAANTRLVVLVCMAYSSTNEIMRGVERSFGENLGRVGGGRRISTADIEKHFLFSGHPDPDVIIRSSGETRLSNFVLWQSAFCLLYAPQCLWPEISLRHLVWAVLLFQRHYSYLEKIKREL